MSCIILLHSQIINMELRPKSSQSNCFLKKHFASLKRHIHSYKVWGERIQEVLPRKPACCHHDHVIFEVKTPVISLFRSNQVPFVKTALKGKKDIYYFTIWNNPATRVPHTVYTSVRADWQCLLQPNCFCPTGAKFKIRDKGKDSRMPYEHPGMQREILGSRLYTHFLTPGTQTNSTSQLFEGGSATSCLTSVLICAGMLTNSGLEANAVRFSTASIKGAVAILHLLRFSSEKSPSRAWKSNHDRVLSQQVSLQN